MNFDEAEEKFRTYKARQNDGELSQAELERHVSELMVQDDRGVWWTIHPESGDWFFYDGNGWVSDTRPRAAAARSEQEAVASTERTYSPSLRTAGTASAAQRNFTRAINNQQVRSRAVPPQENHGFRWVVFAMAASALLLVLIIAWAVMQIAPQSSPRATSTRAPLLALATSTSLPTPVRLPTSLAPAGTLEPVLAQVIETRVNVRAAPNLQAQVITTIPRDRRITLIAKSEDNQWYRAEYQKGAQPGWIFGETLKIVQGNAQALDVTSP